MNNITVNHLGPIDSGHINFGDLTLLVGPHATGKSILLQMIKLLADKGHIRRTTEQYGYIWGNSIETAIDRYFGEGMSGIISTDTKLFVDEKPYPIVDLINTNEKAEETIFYIPAQRVVGLQNGWPRFFTDYEDSVPYVLRHFCETLRQYLESSTSQKNNTIFPQKDRLEKTIQNSYNNSIFHDGVITLDRTVKKRFKLNIGNSSIPYMAWSAGQKEFMPLLLSFYWLCPPHDTSRKDGIKYVIIEEPEMGLHPQAIESVILQILDLLARDYKVIVSTHSPVLLEFAWVFKYLKEGKANGSLLSELFGIKDGQKAIVDHILNSKSINTYYFDRKDNKVDIKDISTLDAGSQDTSIAEWGGLSSFSSKASDIIARTVAQNN